jgi:hypothetical protein
MKPDIGSIVGPSLWSDIVEVWDKAGKAAGLFTLPTLTLSAVFTKMAEPVLSFWAVIVTTWPLVISVWIIALLFWRGDVGNKSGCVGWFYIFCALLFPYVIANIAGVTGPLPTLSQHSNWPAPFNAFPDTMVQIVQYYFGAYGFSRTVSAVICGVFLAWVFHKKLLPRVRAQAPAAAAPTPPPPTGEAH